MNKVSAVLLVAVAIAGLCRPCEAQYNGSYASAQDYRLPRADGSASGFNTAVDAGNSNYSGSGLRGPVDTGSAVDGGPQYGVPGGGNYGAPAAGNYGASAAGNYGAPGGNAYAAQTKDPYGGSFNTNPYGAPNGVQYDQNGAPIPNSNGVDNGGPAPFSGAKVKGNSSAAGAVVGVPDRAAKTAVGATDKAAKTGVGVTGKAVKEVFKAIF